MSCEITKTYRCDMCGAVIDTHDDEVMLNSFISGGSYYYVLVHEHNPSYAEGYRTRIESAAIDLCPSCANRATAIHREVVPTEDGRSCHHEYTWREGDAE